MNSYVNSATVYCLLLRTVLCVHVFVLYLYAALYASRYRGINYTLTCVYIKGVDQCTEPLGLGLAKV